MGTPRKYKAAMNMALGAEKYLEVSKFACEIQEILSGQNFRSIPANDRSSLLKLSGIIVLYREANIDASTEQLKKAARQQEKYLAELKQERYQLLSKRRSIRPTKKEKALSEQIFSAELELYRIMLLRARVTLLGAKPGSIVHCRNIVNQVREKVKEDSWKFRFILAYCFYIEALTYRYAKTSQNLNSFDLNIQDFLSFISNIQSKSEELVPIWITELVHEAWVWQAVQLSRREKYSEALEELLLIQSGTPFLSVYVQANVQICFIEAFKMGKLEGTNESLDKLKQYDMPPNLKLMWYLSKVYCQKSLKKQSDEDYKENVIHLNQLIAKSGFLLKGAFQQEIEKLKTI